MLIVSNDGKRIVNTYRVSEICVKEVEGVYGPIYQLVAVFNVNYAVVLAESYVGIPDDLLAILDDIVDSLDKGQKLYRVLYR